MFGTYLAQRCSTILLKAMSSIAIAFSPVYTTVETEGAYLKVAKKAPSKAIPARSGASENFT